MIARCYTTDPPFSHHIGHRQARRQTTNNDISIKTCSRLSKNRQTYRAGRVGILKKDSLTPGKLCGKQEINYRHVETSLATQILKSITHGNQCVTHSILKITRIRRPETSVSTKNHFASASSLYSFQLFRVEMNYTFCIPVRP